VRETIGAVRTRFPEGRVLALFEPRTNTSRRSIFQEEYALAFDGAACAFIAPPFGADKLAPEARFDSAMLARALTARGIPAESPPDIDALVRAAVKTARPGDALLCMSNGAFGGVHGKLLAALGERERER
jgi:UDP-N-acetylmuramate: L-alanyl-gamma-D-glutamyl-meso-diaminopimelate ligase